MSKKQSLLWFTVLALVAGYFYTAGLAYGRPDPALSPATVKNGWLNGATVFHPDAFAYAGLAYAMLIKGTFNPRYFHNPSLSIYMNLALYAVSGSAALYHNLIDPRSGPPAPLICEDGRPPHPNCTREAAPFSAYVMAQFLAALTMLIGVACAYQAGRVLTGRGGGLFAAALTAFAPLTVQHAHYALPSAATVAACAAALAAALILYRNRSRNIPLHIAAGLAVGFAISARYNAAVIGAVTAFAFLGAWWSHRRVVPMLLGGIAVPVGFLIGTPGAVLAARQFIDDVRYILNWYRAEGGGPGFTLDSGLLAIGYHWRYLILIGFGLPGALIAAWGLIRMLAGRGWRWIGVGMTVFFAAYSLTALTGARLNANLLLPLIPVLAALAAYALRGLRSSQITVAIGAACIVWTGALGGLVANRFQSEDTRMAAQRWVFGNIPAGARIHLLGSYNVPLDPTVYRVTQSYGGTLPSEDAGWSADVIIYSDAYPFAALRDPALTRNATDLEAIRATAERLQAEYTAVTIYPRLAWPGASLPPDDLSVWHHPEIVIYCRPAGCPKG